MRLAFTIVAFLCLLVARAASPAALALVESDTSASNFSQLARNPVWLTLLHFEGKQSGEQYSAIVSDTFFISDQGHVSAEDELNATISAFLVEADSEKSYQCQYPARFKWLRSQVPVLADLEPYQCEEFESWKGDSSIVSASIVFAAGHMKSPASYFGHNFLKFNSDVSSNFLLDHTINYGAEVPPEHGAVPYLYNGIFGGYRATYETQQFIRHMALYGEEDLRDLWEYELDLTLDEVELLLLHAWELKNHQLSYYFFRENCAYHIARLLGLATSELLVPRYMPWTMPYNVMSRLVEVEREGKSLVKNITYHPSRRSRFRRGFLSLGSTQKATVQGFIATGNPASHLPLDAASDQSAVAMIDTLLDYYELLLKADEDNADAKDARRRLLLERLSYPPSTDVREMSERVNPPHLASKPGYLSFGYLTNNSNGEAFELSIRPAYFDYLSDNIGRSNIGNFTLLDARLKIQNEELRLRSLKLMDIANLVPSSTGIAGDTATSWRFTTGFDQTNNACDACLQPMLEWQIGRTWSVNTGFSVFALTGLRLQGRYKQDNPLVLKSTLGLSGQLGSNAKVFVTFKRHEDVGPQGHDRNQFDFQLRFYASPGWDIRMNYALDVAEEFNITFGKYW